MANTEEAKTTKQTPPRSEAVLKELLSTKPGTNEEAMREYELALMELGGVYRDQRFVHWSFFLLYAVANVYLLGQENHGTCGADRDKSVGYVFICKGQNCKNR